MRRLDHVTSFRIPAEERSTASDHRREVAPRGTLIVNDRMRAAARQKAEGATLGEIAKLYGVSRGTVSKWCSDVRTADEDARNLRGGR